MEANTINILKQCNNIREYIVNCYVYCEQNFIGIHDYYFNNDLDILKKVSEKVKEKKDNFSYSNLPTILTDEEALINLLIIDTLIEDGRVNIKYQCFFDDIIKSSIDNKNYKILPKLKDVISNNIPEEHYLRDVKDRPIELLTILNNFLVVEEKLNGLLFEHKKLSSDVENLLQIAIASNSLKIGVFSNEIIPVYEKKYIESESSRKTFFIHSITNEYDILGEIQKILEFAYSNLIKIIVLPELFIYKETRNFISEWLLKYNKNNEIILIVAGSMHCCINNEYFNESVIFNHNGKEEWKQKKLEPFINQIKNENEMEYFNYNDKKIVVVDSILGRLSVSICLDFISKIYPKLLKKLYTNINFVPALTAKTQEFQNKARNLGSDYFYSVFCSNTIFKLNDSKNKDRGFIYIPMRNYIKNEFKNDNNLNFIQIDIFNL